MDRAGTEDGDRRHAKGLGSDLWRWWDDLPPKVSQRAAWGLLIAIILLGAGLRFAWFSGRMLQQFDEFTYWWRADRLLEHDTRTDIYARPLHHLMLAGPMAIFGVDDWAARLPQAVLGILTVPLVYLLGRRLFGRLPGLIAAFWLATAARPIEASRSAMAESDALFFLMAGTLAYIWTRGVGRTPSLWGTVGAGVLLGASLVCHPVTGYFLLPVVLVEAALVVRGRDQSLRLFALFVLLVSIALPGWFFDVLFAKLRFTPGWQVSADTYYEQLFNLRSVVEAFNPANVKVGLSPYLTELQLSSCDGLLGLIAALGAAGSLWIGLRRRSPLAVLPALLWSVPLALWAWVIPIFAQGRNVFSAVGPQAVLIGLGASLVLSGVSVLARTVTKRGAALANSSPMRYVLQLAAPAANGLAVLALLGALLIPSWEYTRQVLTQRRTPVWEAYQATRSGFAVYYPKDRAYLLGRLFGRDQYVAAENLEGLLRMRPRPRFAVFYGPRREDWLATAFYMRPIVDGGRISLPSNFGSGAVRVYDLSALWQRSQEATGSQPTGRSSPQLIAEPQEVFLAPGEEIIKSDGWQYGQETGGAKICGRAGRCRKTLYLPMSPKALTEAKLLYLMKQAAQRRHPWAQLCADSLDPGVELWIDLNGIRVSARPVTDTAMEGWHTVSLPLDALVQGENTLTFSLSETGKACVFLAVAPIASRAGNNSAATNNDGKTWTGEMLSAADIWRGQKLTGEYVVRLMVRKSQGIPARPEGDRL